MQTAIAKQLFHSLKLWLPSFLVFVAGLQRTSDEGSLPEIAQYSPYYFPLNVSIASKGSNLYILFVITAAGVVPCGSPKKSPRTSSIV